MVKGTPKFDALAVGEIHVDFMKGQVHMEAVAAFVDSSSKAGDTHGWTKGSGNVWSRATMDRLAELRESMEKDLGAIHFGSTQEAGPRSGEKLGAVPTGIGEHLGDHDAPSV